MADEVVTGTEEGAGGGSPFSGTEVKAGEEAKAGEEPKKGEDGKEPKAGEEPKKGEDGKEPKEGEEPKKGEDGKEPKKGEVSDTYEDFTLPEGFEVNEEELASFKDVAKELGLTQEQAQKLVDFETERMKSSGEAQAKQWFDTVDTWLADAKKDDEIGGENFDKSVELGKRFLKSYASDDFIKLLDQFGFGNHPEFIRLAARAGKDLSEDDVFPGRGGGEPKSAAQRIFGKQS